MDVLSKLRNRIDWLDSQIASLLSERMKAADQVGRIKKLLSIDITDASRELDVLQHVEAIVQHPILKANIANIYEKILHEARTAQSFLQVSSIPFRRIGIIGVGLIGGSICQALKTKDSTIEISVLGNDSPDLTLARTNQLFDRECTSISSLAQHSDLIIIASPISTVIPIAEEIAKCRLKDRLVVADVASVKRAIAARFEILTTPQIEFIATHPMSGKEKGGFSNSSATLFVQNHWIITQHNRNTTERLHELQNVIQFLGSKPFLLDPSTHDLWAAIVSHLPLLISNSYYNFSKEIEPESLTIAGPGFASFTRLAGEQKQLRDEITAANRDFIKKYLKQWILQLKSIEKAL